MNDIDYLHAFNSIPDIGQGTLRKLVRFFESAQAAWEASVESLEQSGIRTATAKHIAKHRATLNVEALASELQTLNIQCFDTQDIRYPKLLKEIPDAPAILYQRGNIDLNAKPVIAIVGSRKATPYGKRVTESLAQDLAQAGFVIASGLAFGIDSIAHQSLLATPSSTIAVLGNGLADHAISPQAQLPLAHHLLRHGHALLSEYSPHTPAAVYTFPARNRIIAGLSLGTIVIEAAEKSGSLITAKYALDYNREVFAVPGSVFSEASAGPHMLLRQGAKLVGSVTDILAELGPITRQTKQSNSIPQNLPQDEQNVFQFLSVEPVHVDSLSKSTALPIASIQSLLLMLEMKGLAKNVGNMHYIRL